MSLCYFFHGNFIDIEIKLRTTIFLIFLSSSVFLVFPVFFEGLVPHLASEMNINKTQR